MEGLCPPCRSLCASQESIESLCSTGYKAHQDIGCMLKTAKDGCPMCQMLLDPSYALYDWFPTILERPQFKVKLVGQLDSNGKLKGFQMHADKNSYRPQNGESWDEYQQFTVHVKDKGKSLSAEAPYQVDAPKFDSSKALDIVRKWSAECAKHKECMSTAKRKLPKRVLDLGVGEGAGVKLLEPKDIRDQYAILSYCWGGEQDVLTDSNTLAAHLQQIDVPTLAQTIQDAIKIVREIGIRYLWVDALCILQKDDQDKMLEIAKMHQYFKMASLTIIAGGASKAQDGFLHGRGDPSCTVAYFISESQEALATVRHVTEDPDEYTGETNKRGFSDRVAIFRSPISNRAWTFEESLLSRRKLRYGTHQVEWECRKTFGSFKEVLDKGLVQTHESSVTSTQDPPAFDYFATNYKPSVGTVVRSWSKALENYTSRHLTKPEDKLPAIGAIAHEFQRATGHTYLAGIWQERLHNDLMWHFDERKRPRYEPQIAAAPLDRAPSWSWASVDGRIKAGFVPEMVAVEAELRAVRVSPKSPHAPFGQVKPGGYIELDARVKQVPPLDPDEDEVEDRFPAYDELGVRFDVEPEDNWVDCEAWYLWLATIDEGGDLSSDDGFEDRRAGTAGKMREKSSNRLAIGLIVKSVGEGYDFRRIGVFIGVPLDWFAGTMKYRLRLF